MPTITSKEDDQIVPFADAGPLSAKLLKNARTKFYPGYPHGMSTTHADVISTDPARLHQVVTITGKSGADL